MGDKYSHEQAGRSEAGERTRRRQEQRLRLRRQRLVAGGASDGDLLRRRLPPQYTFALPTLRKQGWPGVLNLKAEGSDLYQSNLAAMLAAGWELAAHTINHSDLARCGVDPDIPRPDKSRPN